MNKRKSCDTTIISTFDQMIRILGNPSITECNDGRKYTYYYQQTDMTISTFKGWYSPDNQYIWQIQGSSEDDIASLEALLKSRLSNDNEEHIRQKSGIQHQCDF